MLRQKTGGILQHFAAVGVVQVNDADVLEAHAGQTLHQAAYFVGIAGTHMEHVAGALAQGRSPGEWRHIRNARVLNHRQNARVVGRAHAGHQRKGTALADHLLDVFGGALRHVAIIQDLQLHHAAVDAAARVDLRQRSFCALLDVAPEPGQGAREGSRAPNRQALAADACVLRKSIAHQRRGSQAGGQARGNSDKLATLHKKQTPENSTQRLAPFLEQLISVRGGFPLAPPSQPLEPVDNLCVAPSTFTAGICLFIPLAGAPHTMSIWKKPISVEQLTASGANTAVSHLGIELTEVGDDFLRGRVPVDERTRQPFGLLHGGVSVVLAETLGSMGAFYASPEGHRAVGLDINANHLRAATSGWVTGTARPVHIGRTTQVWQIDMVNDAGELTCVSRITMAVLAPKG